MDVGRLYTNIPYSKRVHAMSELLGIHRNPKELTHDHYIIQLLREVLENNYFSFNGRHFHQIVGTVLGTKLVLSHANIFMSHLDDQYVTTCKL